MGRADEPGTRLDIDGLINPRLHDDGELRRHGPHVNDPPVGRHLDMRAQQLDDL